MKTELILIGDELLYGKTRDLNAFWLGPFLRDRGMTLDRVTLIHDNEIEIQNTLREAFQRVDIVITSGGLGPTGDDLTKISLANYFKKELFPSEEAKKIVKENYSRFAREWKPEQNFYHQVPRDFLIVSNPAGQAPGLAYIADGKAVFAAPGVPREFKAMIEKEYFPLIQKYFSKNLQKPSRKIALRTYGVPEEIIFFELCPGLWQRLESLGKVSSLPLSTFGGVDIVLQVDDCNYDSTLEKIHELIDPSPLAPYIWQWGDEELPSYVLKKAINKKLTFAFAESCSGGLCSSRITDIAGSSEAFKGGIVCYDEKIKKEFLNVSKDTLSKYGVYSPECAKEMAQGLQKLFNVNYAISLSGIAGPSGGTANNPIGTVYIGWSSQTNSGSECYYLKGDRITLKERFSQRALLTLLQKIEEKD